MVEQMTPAKLLQYFDHHTFCSDFHLLQYLFRRRQSLRCFRVARCAWDDIGSLDIAFDGGFSPPGMKD